MTIESERDLLEVRAELKRFKKIEPKKILSILKTIKECNQINKEWIRKTKITKTLVRISLFKYPSQDETRIMVGKFAKALVMRFKSFFPKLKTASTESAPAGAEGAANAPQPQQNAVVAPSKPAQAPAAKPVEPKKTESTESSTKADQLPTYKNDRRNQGLLGIIKYFQKGFDESKMSASNQICVEIEKFLHERNSKGESFNEANYKEDVKKLCKQFIDKDNAAKSKTQIYDEFQIKKCGGMDCVKEILK